MVGIVRGRSVFVVFVAMFLGIAAVPGSARAHDLKLQIEELRRGTADIRRALERLHAQPAIPRPPRTRDEQRRALGEAEIDLALGHRTRALGIILGRLADPTFRALPEYLPTLLLASQILEEIDEPVGAMIFARRALEQGGGAKEMGEAGARWFRLARLHNWFEDRTAILDLWNQRGGLGAAGVNLAAEAAYEAAFALRASGQQREAQALLATIPSGSTYGSRAAYLAGVLFVEAGDLQNAERWFAAVMDWPLPMALDDGEARLKLEQEVRELAALSAGRLRYERGDLDAADDAYGRVGDGSPHLVDACYERAFLALERRRRRGALTHLRCVEDLGPRGDRYVDVRLTRASLLAHLARYSESVDSYQYLHQTLTREASLVQEALGKIGRPAEFLFAGMERSSADTGKLGTPGPATLFGDSWTADVDHAYRLDRAVSLAAVEIASVQREVARIRVALDRVDAFAPLESRRRLIHQLIRDIQHLQGHSSDVLLSAKAGHASVGTEGLTEHEVESAEAARLLVELDRHAKTAETQLVALDDEEKSRRAQADVTLRELERELEGLAGVASALKGDIGGVADTVGREALDHLLHRFEDAVMRAEAGVLDTFWIRKEHTSQQIRAIAEEKEHLRDEFDAAAKETAKDLE